MDTLESTAYNLLCVDLGYPPTNVPDAVKTYLEHRISAARARLKSDGIPVTDPADAAGLDLLVMYAAYLYRRRDSNEPMPASLRLAINDARVSRLGKESAS